MDKHGKRRSAAMRDMHLQLVTGWIIRGWSQQRMAAELGISEAQASKDVSEVERRWRMDTFDYRIAKGRELAAIDKQIDELWEAWEKSKKAREKKTAEQHEGTFNGKLTNGTIRGGEVEEQYGDPRIMAEITKLREQRIKLLGLNEPTKIALTDTQGRSIFPEIKDDDLNTAITILKQAGSPYPAAITEHSGGAGESEIIDAEPLPAGFIGSGEGTDSAQ